MKSSADKSFSANDHRALGRDLDLFAGDPIVGSGLPLWLPAGSVIRDELERLARDIARADGCVSVHTPVLGKRALFERSGHWAKFADDMFVPIPSSLGSRHSPDARDSLRSLPPTPSSLGSRQSPDARDSLRSLPPTPSSLESRQSPDARDSLRSLPPMALGDEQPGDQLVLRPANCPHHAMIYAARPHSYRELPIRLNELAPMFRAERSGVVSGLTRVRQINLDDTHVFCRPDQVASEAERALRSALHAQRILGLSVDYVRLSLPDDEPGYLGDPAAWAEAGAALRRAANAVDLASYGLELVEVAGEAAFYGPKLDLQVLDGNGHEETISTVQLDFVQPQRFNLVYDGPNDRKEQVVMIHRGTVGSMERVTAALLERYDGRLPLWLNPVQLAVLPVSESVDAVARQFVDDLVARGLRAQLDAAGSLGSRIRRARSRRHYAFAVIGDCEAADGSVQVNDVFAGHRGSLPREAVADILTAAYAARARPRWPASPDD